MKQPIYLDYNATTPIDPQVAESMLPFIKECFGNPSSPYALGKQGKEAIELARSQVAELIYAQPDEIIFTSCASESNNLAIQGIAMANKNKGNHIITSAIEHPAVSEVCKYLSLLGFCITYLPVDKFGMVHPIDIEKAVRKETILISIMHSNNEVGTIQPISEIATFAHARGIAFHTDAAQSVGKIKTNVEELGVDLLTIAGHKLYAPKGIGALYIKKGTILQRMLFGAGQEKGLRPGTENTIHIVALGKACELAKDNFQTNYQIMRDTRDKLAKGFIKRLGENMHIHSDLNNCLPNTLSIAFKNIDAQFLASELSQEVYFSTGSACHAHSVEISPVLKAMRVEPEIALGTVRVSTGKYTTAEEIEKAVDLISSFVLKSI
jgi:cysteine desulfurase